MSHPVDVAAALRPRPPSPLQEVEDERFTRRGVRLLLKREDLVHATADGRAAGPGPGPGPGPVELYPSGNKWRKLAPNLRAVAESSHRRLLTFGGAYSNHLRATAAAGRLLGLRTVGVVRGHELADRPLNPSLARCTEDGMLLHFVTRADYRRRADPAFHHELRARFGPCAVVPEGGSNAAAVRGCAALGAELRGHTDVAAVACGTGGTLAGMAAGLSAGQRGLGVPVLKGGFLGGEIARLQRETFGGPRGDWWLEERFHGGGYARTSPELSDFAADFAQRHGLPALEETYVTKLLFALTRLTEEGAFPRGSTVTAVVTGRASASEW
ncbi:1-aminocyclopropane-1-carboxylate deaminase [Streptomyces qinglanensis]|uniref:1-aminocyclopropane-1-carboxylate deaminase n=1 Tax=Streptomyces qinglanensis TaxID=943816 RepID=A0A1E7K922_9ACTN|nr:pyridoxal-phosphate dependent enzyme [Streptomyces qinglanensis]OEV00396.1 1-aminocyclopropane-1-carboxylate deaminase [Streptomyces qinglanensis]OEV25609.1 1-aminocyclopropane-1-carboxylate deaminase [Streptomyces nanshensis]OEV25610.1 1-aminocyclopropane-1-carboxylate deaminase [Streptomyces nanshensis]